MLAEMRRRERRACFAPLGIARTGLLDRVLPSSLKSGLFSLMQGAKSEGGQLVRHLWIVLLRVRNEAPSALLRFLWAPFRYAKQNT